MIDAVLAARINLDPYKEWCDRERLPIAEGIAIDLFGVDVGDWDRVGAKGAIVNCKGRGDFCNMFLYELPAGGSTTQQQHLYEEVFFVLDGRGSTQVEMGDGSRRSFEWGPRSFFAVPLNAKHRHFNGSGSQRARLVSTSNFPLMINTFHSEEFLFGGTQFSFSDRFGKKEHYAGEGDLFMIRQGNNIWETNFVPDMAELPLTDYADRGPGSSNIKFVLADGLMYAHMSEIASATYKKGHRHTEGVHVLTLTGGGYSLLWYEGQTDFERIDWKYGTVFPPLENQFHQHFVTSPEPSRYIATTIGSLRYPWTERHRKFNFGEKGKRQGSSTSLKDGGGQIEYEDQDPRIHQIWLEEMRKNGVTPRFDAPGKLRAS
jgi:mannose-6-phosphate isomerase-like protein (cupin superfamily)